MDASLRKLLKVADSNLGIITTDDAGRYRISDDRLSHLVGSGILVRMHRGVYRLASGSISLEQRALAACLACGEGAACSHRTAGSLWTLGREPERIDVTLPRGRRSRIPDIAVHRRTLDKRDLTQRGLIPITSVGRTLVDLAGVLVGDALEEALDVALRDRLVTPERVLASCGRAPGNTRGLALLTELVRDRAEHGVPGSKLERIAIRLIRRAHLPQPRRQFRLRVDGRRFDMDLAYPEQRIAIELEGQRPHWDRWQSDHDRHYLVELAGWRPVYFTWEDATRRPLKFILHVAEAVDLWPTRWGPRPVGASVSGRRSPR